MRLILLLTPFFLPGSLSARFSLSGSDFTDVALCFLGDARALNDRVRLTPDSTNKVGAIWYNGAQIVGGPFTTRFRFRMGVPGTRQQADGLAFVISNTDDKNSCHDQSLGRDADGIGYAGLRGTLAIEFDTWHNDNEQNGNHIAIHSRGLDTNSSGNDGLLAIAVNVPTLGRGEEHLAIIDYDGKTLRVYLDDCSQLVLEYRVDLVELLKVDRHRATAFVGITASTGSGSQEHDILSWEFYPLLEFPRQYCYGDSAFLAAPGGYSAYRWSTGDTTQIIKVDKSGRYEVYITGLLTCPESVPAFVFDVVLQKRHDRPFLSPEGPVMVCEGDSVELTAMNLYPGDILYWWTVEPRQIVRKLHSIVVWQSGKYFLQVVDTNDCYYQTDTVEVIVRPRPVPQITPDPPPRLCAGDSIVLRVRQTYAQYEWSGGERTAEIAVRSPGTYTVRVVDSNGCEGYDTVRIDPVTEELSATPDVAVCRGEAVQLNASGRSEYLWSPADGLSCTDCPNPTAAPEKTTTYAVRGTANGSCRSFDTVVVTVLDLPHADAGEDRTLCLGDSLKLDAFGEGTYSWTPAVNLSCLNCPDPVAFPRESITYYLQVTGENGCVARDSVRVTVQRSGSVAASGDAAFCPGGTAQLSASGAESYRWSPAEGLSCTDCANPTARPEKTTTYYVIGTNAFGECPALDSVTVTIHDLPVIDAGADAALCGGESVQLNASGGVRYRWDPSSDLSCLDCPDPTATPTKTTTYYVTGTNAEGCESRDSVRVEIRPGFTVDAGEDRAICIGDSVRLSAIGGERWLWEPAEGLSCTDCADPMATPEKTTMYRVTAWNAEGCSAVDSVSVTVRDEPETIRLRIGRTYKGHTDQRLVIPVEIVREIGTTDISEFEFVLEYDPQVMQVDGRSVERFLSGTALEGWSVTVERSVPGRLDLRLTAPAGEALHGMGDLLRFEGKIYLSGVTGTELPFTVNTSSRCFVLDTEAGYAQVDSICGLNFRLIELTSEKYVVPTAYPNPARDRVRFEFGLGLDGATRLEVFDLLGNRVGLILDGYLQPGRYGVEWDVRDVPSGVYWYRLTSGDWSGGGEVRVAR